MSGINLHTRAAYRSGAAGALLDEYEKALNELIRLIKPLDEATILRLADPEAMFQITLQVFLDYPKLKLETNNPEEKILTHWGQHYDVEQWLEYAIVHILRHRRQIERFLG